LGMLSRRINNFPESGRSLGHVTPSIFGSTVGYPSDSLASCSTIELNSCDIPVEKLDLLPNDIPPGRQHQTSKYTTRWPLRHAAHPDTDTYNISATVLSTVG